MYYVTCYVIRDIRHVIRGMHHELRGIVTACMPRTTLSATSIPLHVCHVSACSNTSSTQETAVARLWPTASAFFATQCGSCLRDDGRREPALSRQCSNALLPASHDPTTNHTCMHRIGTQCVSSDEKRDYRRQDHRHEARQTDTYCVQ